MSVYYFTDARLTGSLASLTSTALDDATKRAALVRLPAAAWVDSVFPYSAPFADVAATPSTPQIIQMGALAYGLHLAYRVLTKDAENGQSKAYLADAERLFHIDKDTGFAMLLLSGVDDLTSRLSVVTLTRSRTGEDYDELINQQALYPGGGP